MPTQGQRDPLDPQEQELLHALRKKRLALAKDRQVPAYWVLTDATLHHLVAMRPAELAGLLDVPGIGPAKLANFGLPMHQELLAQATRLGLEVYQEPPPPPPKPPRPQGTEQGPRQTARWREKARDAFRGGATLQEVSLQCDVKPSAALEELLAVVRESRAPTLAPWVAEPQLQQVRQAGAALGLTQLTPLYDYLQGEMPYPLLRLCRDFLRGPTAADQPGEGERTAPPLAC